MGYKEAGILLTEKCNYQCRHCFLSCSPRGKTLSLESIKKIIDHLPENINGIYLSGGEVFTERKLLYEVLLYLDSKNFPMLQKNITILTNCFWGHDEVFVQKTINELIDLNLGFTLSLTTYYDIFHEEQGSKLEYIVSIENGVRNKPARTRLQTLFPTPSPNYPGYGFANPVGRAVEHVPRERWNKKYRCNGHVKLNPECCYFTVDFCGQVHGCCWQVPPVLGNAIDKPVSEILEEAGSNEIFQWLEIGGIRAVASFMRWSKEDIEKEIEIGGECYLCGKVFSKR